MKFIFIIIIYLIIEFILSIYSFKNIDYNNLIKICNKSFIFSSKYLKWRQKIDNSYNPLIKKIKNNERILFISNHVSLMDFIHYIYFFTSNFPDHRIICVTKKCFTNIPYIGKIINDNAIIAEDIYDKNKDTYIKKLKNIKKKIKNLIDINNNKKTIILLFPEGKIYNNINIIKSNSWCEKIGIEKFYNSLCPHINGLYSILNVYKPQEIITTKIKYSDDIYNKKGKEYYHFILNYIPKQSNIFLNRTNIIKKYYNNVDKKSHNNKEYFKEKIIKLWRENYEV